MKIAVIVDSVMLKLDPNKLLDLEIYSLASKKVNDMVRREVNKMHGRPKDAQGNLLPKLQRYYPRPDGKVYIRLEYMSEADLLHYIHRMRGEVGSKTDHINDLDEYRKRRFPGTKISII